MIRFSTCHCGHYFSEHDGAKPHRCLRSNCDCGAFTEAERMRTDPTHVNENVDRRVREFFAGDRWESWRIDCIFRYADFTYALLVAPGAHERCFRYETRDGMTHMVEVTQSDDLPGLHAL